MYSVLAALPWGGSELAESAPNEVGTVPTCLAFLVKGVKRGGKKASVNGPCVVMFTSVDQQSK